MKPKGHESEENKMERLVNTQEEPNRNLLIFYLLNLPEPPELEAAIVEDGMRNRKEESRPKRLD